MHPTITNLLKCASVPALMAASILLNITPGYDLLLRLAVCLLVAALMQRAIRSGQYVWACGLVVVGISFGPFHPFTRLYLLMGFFCFASLLGLYLSYRLRPLGRRQEAV